MSEGLTVLGIKLLYPTLAFQHVRMQQFAGGEKKSIFSKAGIL